MLILLVLLIFFAALGIPLAFAIGASCVTYILIYAPTFITMLPQRVWNGAYSELMIAMPLFMLAGELMNTGGITQRMPIIEIFKGAAPYVICNVIVLISISLWGPLTTALPQLLGYSIF